MKSIVISLAAVLALSGCAGFGNTTYYETVQSVSKDNTMSQTACWAAITEIARGGDPTTRIGAIALAEKCKNQSVLVNPPQRNWLGF